MAQDKGRTEIQKKTFTRWVNTHLIDRNLEVKELTTDFKNGVLLINLLEIISSKKIKKWKKKPKIKAQQMENLNKAMKFIKDEGIKTVNIDADDLYNGNLKIILGLIWTLILRYQINKGDYLDIPLDANGRPDPKSPQAKKRKKKKDDAPKKELLDWVNKQLKPYNQSVKGFKSQWKNPQIICSLTDSLQPGLMDLDKISDEKAPDQKRTKDIQEAMSKAETNFSIPQVIDASDMAVLPDELSMMTYVSYFRDKANELEAKRAAGGKSYANGPGLESGIEDMEPREFTVYCLDKDKKPMLPEDHDIVEVSILDPQGDDVKVEIERKPTETYPGEYLVKYCAEKAGKYSIKVCVKEAVLMGYPKEILINPASVGDIKSCKFSFTIYAADEDGQPETEGGDLFEVKLQNEHGENFEVHEKDNGDGSYTASYSLNHGHLYKVYANLNGEAIANSPFIHDMRTNVDKTTYVY